MEYFLSRITTMLELLEEQRCRRAEFLLKSEIMILQSTNMIRKSRRIVEDFHEAPDRGRTRR
ncbi:hypothetical protein [Azospirillum picis]|uniref:Uncharacterized protein n=1 Tax=Azospirillum picis TaxID=488438 RepID=A0ABU0MT24_9PROT|nr:hypothetical protein [Azospirillum picis]MBP2302875.1 hypothetical protein [Azospirillum picis]MDQ0536620.1 hypothetical protein [Azospirillum picis]